MVLVNQMFTGSSTTVGNTGFNYGTTTMNYTFTNVTASTARVVWGYAPPKIKKNNRFKVRCRGCARFARVVGELPGRWVTECARCPGVDEGFVKW